MINGWDATTTREFTNATFTVEVFYQGKSSGSHSFGVCAAAAFGVDGFPKCPWKPGTKLHVIDNNPADSTKTGLFSSTWKMVDSNNQTLFCMKTNWTLHPMAIAV